MRETEKSVGLSKKVGFVLGQGSAPNTIETCKKGSEPSLGAQVIAGMSVDT